MTDELSREMSGGGRRAFREMSDGGMKISFLTERRECRNTQMNHKII